LERGYVPERAFVVKVVSWNFLRGMIVEAEKLRFLIGFFDEDGLSLCGGIVLELFTVFFFGFNRSRSFLCGRIPIRPFVNAFAISAIAQIGLIWHGSFLYDLLETRSSQSGERQAEAMRLRQVHQTPQTDLGSRGDASLGVVTDTTAPLQFSIT
jgi:hypothetical protein